MTREEILNMPAGKEMDALIAEKIFKFGDIQEFVSDFSGQTFSGWIDDTNKSIIRPEFWKPSENIETAWEVVNKTSLFNVCVLYGSDSDQRWVIIITKPEFGEVEIIAETAPLAICRAALLATT